jgi:hypothetical protein
MMNINRQNYEIWFIDFIDGKLDEKAKKAFYVFLDANSDLAEELHNFENIKLVPEAVLFSRKENLHRSEADLMGIDTADFLLIKQMEEGLNSNEEKELAGKIKKDESLIKKGEEFQLSHLSAELSEFPNKKSLLRRDLVNVYSIAVRVASVAAVLVLLMIAYQWRLKFSISEKPVAVAPVETNTKQMENIKTGTDQLAKVNLNPLNRVDEKEIMDNTETLSINKKVEDARTTQQPPVMKLMVSKSGDDVKLPVIIPNVYETGLRQMMPLYLDLNNRRKALLASLDRQKRSGNNSLLMKGLQFVDRFGGDLVKFDRLYDEDGNYVAYNFKAGNIKMEQKVKH